MTEFRYDPGPAPGVNENWPDPQPVALKKCAEPTCDKTKPDADWAHRTPEGEGWFDQRNGDSWCPEHIPAWYTAWKAKKR